MRLLIAEDDPRLQVSLARGLRAEGFAVDVAGTGEEALFHLRVHNYDVVVLDVMLPAPDGFTVCRTLRAEGRWTPVLMLTALDGIPNRIEGLDCGADDYMVKPFDFGELVARLRALLRRGQPERPPVLVVGGLRLDPATRQVTADERPVELTMREFAVLEFLMRRAGQVVSRTALIDHVWDQNYEGSGNVVDVYIGYLRRKLEGSSTGIRTVRGAGFIVGDA